MGELPQHAAAPAVQGQTAGQYLRSLRPTLIAISVLSLVRGLLQAGTPHTEDAALVLLLNNTSPSANLLRLLYEWPWVVLPLLGVLSDRVPLGGGRWRPYLVAAGAAGCVSSAILASLANSPRSAAVLPLAVARRLAEAAQYLLTGGVMVVAARGAPLGLSGPLLLMRRTLCKVGLRLAWVLAPAGGWASDAARYGLVAVLLAGCALAAWFVQEAPPAPGDKQGATSSKAGSSSSGGGSSEKEVDDSSGKTKRGPGVVAALGLPPTAAGVPWCYLARTILLLVVLQVSAWSARTIAQGLEMSSGFWLGLAGVALYVACWRGADLRALVAGCSWAWLGTGLLSMGSLVGVGGRSSMWLITLVRPLITEVWMAGLLLLAASCCPVGWEATGYGALALLWKATSALTAQDLVPKLLYALDLPHVISTGRQWAALAALCGLLVAPLLLKDWVPAGPDPWLAWTASYSCSSCGGPSSSRGSGGSAKQGKVPAGSGGEVLDEDQEAGLVLLSDAAPSSDQSVSAERSK